MSYKSNHFLMVNGNVILTPLLENVICELEPWFSEAGLPVHVTSGLRTAERQLEIIIDKAKELGIDHEFPSILTATLDDVNSWVFAWGRELQANQMVNPPQSQKAPFDYVRSDGTPRKAGTLIEMSGHQLGQDFDIGQDIFRLKEITDVLDKALADNAIFDLKGYLAESGNHAVHVDCKEAKLNKF